MLVGGAYLRWAAWIWLTVIAVANLHKDHDIALVIASVAITGAVTVACTLALRRGAGAALRPPLVATEIAAAVFILLADGWVEQGRLTGQTLSGSWPIPSILVAALAGGMGYGVGTAVLLGAARAAAVVIGGSPAGQGGRAYLAVVSTAIEWIAFGAAAAVVIRLLRSAERQLAEADVRERIAQDLHDGVLQTLTMIERRSPSAEVARLARDQERELRSYLFGDHEHQDRLGAVLRAAAARFERSWPESVTTVTVSDDVADLEGPVVEAVSGAVTEALTNAAKHGAARRVVLFADLDESTGGLFVTVKDDGIGFDPAQVVEGVGMRQSIRARATKVGGETVFASVPGEGAEVRILIPGPLKARPA